MDHIMIVINNCIIFQTTKKMNSFLYSIVVYIIGFNYSNDKISYSKRILIALN